MWDIPNSNIHSFGYWNDRIYDSTPLNTGNINITVKDRVNGVFQTVFAGTLIVLRLYRRPVSKDQKPRKSED